MFFKRLGIFCSIVLVLFVIGYINTQSGTDMKSSEKSETAAAAKSSEIMTLKSPEQSNTDADSSVLEDRVNRYWQHKIRREFSEQYLFETPYFRDKVNLTNYIKSQAGGITIIDATIGSVVIEGKIAVARLKVKFSMLGAYTPKEGIPHEMKDYWQFNDDGYWYHLRHKPSAKVTEKK